MYTYSLQHKYWELNGIKYYLAPNIYFVYQLLNKAVSVQAWKHRLSVPRIRGPCNCPLLLNRQRQSPRRYEYTRPTYPRYLDIALVGANTLITLGNGRDIRTSGASTIAMFETIIREVCKVPNASRTER